MKYSKSGVSHADRITFERTRTYEEDRAEATDNLVALYPNGTPKGLFLPERVAELVTTERSRRNAHYWRYKAMFRIANDEQLFAGSDNLAEASLKDLNKRVAGMSEQDYEFARSMDGKGISAELGHIDQLGAWDRGRLLDAQVRELPVSDRLSDAGFIFNETYDSKDEAKINYNFYVTPHGPHRVNIKGVRKRAAADIATELGNVFEIVKQSTFLIDNTSLTSSQHRKIEQTIATDRMKPKRKDNGKPDTEDAERIKKLRSEIMYDAGKDIIEPFIGDQHLRERSTAVIAVTSLYFALHRHR